MMIAKIMDAIFGPLAVCVSLPEIQRDSTVSTM